MIAAPMTLPPPMRPCPAVVAVSMGYGHLRAAHALATAWDAPVLHADRAPLAGPAERHTWDRMRTFYEALSRGTGKPVVGGLLRSALDRLTAIPRPAPADAQRAPSMAARHLANLMDDGFGAGLVTSLRESGATLVATFYAPAIVADAAGIDPVVCVVTDSDVNRVWVPLDATKTRIHYAAPTARACRRLRAYGVPAERIRRTGFPLPPELTGGADLALALASLGARLRRLDPRGVFRRDAPASARSLGDAADDGRPAGPPRITFAVGGAGAQREVAQRLVRALREPVARGELALTLVAGTREDTDRALRRYADDAGLVPQDGGALEVLHEPDFAAYAARFHARLATTDLLWTKPSELTFFAALGIPLAFARALGVHERSNAAWATRRGAGLDPGDPRGAARWVRDRLDDGTLARAAWAGLTRLPTRGTERIGDFVAAVRAR